MSYNDIITTIALFDGKNIRYYVHGKNLNDFKKDILNYKVIVTYNGKNFDIPMIENYFNISISLVHLDLRYILYNLGYTGGLKGCEKKLNIQRDKSFEDLDGIFAVMLWRYYKKYKNEKSLNTLLAYNIEDVLSLEYMMVEAYNHNVDLLPIDIQEIPLPKRLKNPFKPNKLIITRVKKGLEKYGLSYLTKKQIPLIKENKIPKKRVEPISVFDEEKPSEILDKIWLYAKNTKLKYPKMTQYGGKLLLFPEKDKVDEMWNFIRVLIYAGELTQYAKVSTALKRNKLGKSSHVICIYTYDIRDIKDIERLRRKLKAYGFVENIPYKSNEETRKNIKSQS